MYQKIWLCIWKKNYLETHNFNINMNYNSIKFWLDLRIY